MTLTCAGESFQLPVTGLAFVQRASLAVGIFTSTRSDVREHLLLRHAGQ